MGSIDGIMRLRVHHHRRQSMRGRCEDGRDWQTKNTDRIEHAKSGLPLDHSNKLLAQREISELERVEAKAEFLTLI